MQDIIYIKPAPDTRVEVGGHRTHGLLTVRVHAHVCRHCILRVATHYGKLHIAHVKILITLCEAVHDIFRVGSLSFNWQLIRKAHNFIHLHSYIEWGDTTTSWMHIQRILIPAGACNTYVWSLPVELQGIITLQTETPGPQAAWRCMYFPYIKALRLSLGASNTTWNNDAGVGEDGYM